LSCEWTEKCEFVATDKVNGTVKKGPKLQNVHTYRLRAPY